MNKIPKMPEGKNPIKANEKLLNSVFEKVSKARGNFDDGKNLKILGEAIRLAVKSSHKLALGDVFLTAATTMLDNVLHDNNEHIPIIHHNMSIPNTAHIKTYAVMGSDYNRKLKSYINGPTYDRFSKDIVTTKEDFLKTDNKRKLYSRAGANQRNITFFGESTHLTLNDIKVLCNYNEKEDIINKERKRVQENVPFNLPYIVEESETLDNQPDYDFPKKLKNNQYKGNARVIKFYSGLLSLTRTFTFYNRMPVYNVKIALHLVRYNDGSLLEPVNRLVNNIHDPVLQYGWCECMSVRNIRGFPSNDNFSKQLVTTLDVNFTKVDSFTKRCTIIKSWERTLETGGSWEFKLKEKFENGIYLNKIHHFDILSIEGNSPSGCFFIAEYIGDPRATITRLADKESFHRVTSPVNISYDFNMSIEHLSKTEDTDDFVSYTMIKDENLFLDESLAEDFYPEREQYLNVDYDKIIIADDLLKNKNKEFKLELDSSILESQESSKIDAYLKSLAKTGKGLVNDFGDLTPDDIPFMGDNTTNSTEDHYKGLRGSNEREDEDDF